VAMSEGKLIQHWICGYRIKDQIQNDDVCGHGAVGVGRLVFEWIEEKILQCYFETGSEFRTYPAKPPDMGRSI